MEPPLIKPYPDTQFRFIYLPQYQTNNNKTNQRPKHKNTMLLLNRFDEMDAKQNKTQTLCQ